MKFNYYINFLDLIVCSFQLLRWLGLHCSGEVLQRSGLLRCMVLLWWVQPYRPGSAVCCGPADPHHSERNQFWSLRLAVWRHRDQTGSNLLCLHHYEPWLCWWVLKRLHYIWKIVEMIWIMKYIVMLIPTAWITYIIVSFCDHFSMSWVNKIWCLWIFTCTRPK